jgi:hypothetical protein
VTSRRASTIPSVQPLLPALVLGVLLVGCASERIVDGPPPTRGTTMERSGGTPRDVSLEVDEDLTIVDAVAHGAVGRIEEDDASERWRVTFRVENHGEVSRYVVPAHDREPRWERVDGRLRVTWFRWSVRSSDPETGAFEFGDARGASARPVAPVGSTSFWTVITDHRGAVDSGEVELCVEASRPPRSDPSPTGGPDGAGKAGSTGSFDGTATISVACGLTRLERRADRRVP